MERDPFVRPVPYPSYRMGGDCRVEIASRYFGGQTLLDCGRLSSMGTLRDRRGQSKTPAGSLRYGGGNRPIWRGIPVWFWVKIASELNK